MPVQLLAVSEAALHRFLASCIELCPGRCLAVGIDTFLGVLPDVPGDHLDVVGVSFEDRQDLLGHRSGRITTHYSAPDLSRLLHAVDSICEQKRATVLRLAGGTEQKSGKFRQ